MCKHWKVIREGSYYKIGNLWLESVRSTKLGWGRQQRLKGEEMSKEKGCSNYLPFEQNFVSIKVCACDLFRLYDLNCSKQEYGKPCKIRQIG